MAKLTTVKLENRGISANIIDCGIIDCSIHGSFKKGHGGCQSWATEVGNWRRGWLVEHGMRREGEKKDEKRRMRREGWEQEVECQLPTQ